MRFLASPPPIESEVKFLNKNSANLQVLRDIVGIRLFKEIMKCLSGEHIHLSDWAGYASKEERNAAIMEDFYAGVDYSELQDKYELSIHAIYKIAEHKPEKYT